MHPGVPRLIYNTILRFIEFFWKFTLFRLIYISSELADIKELVTTSGSSHTTKSDLPPTKDTR